jgi:ATP-binding cassette, subfamily B, bacterial
MDASLITGRGQSGGRLRQLHEAVRFTFPHRYALGAVLALTLLIAAISAAEPLILKFVFDALTGADAQPALSKGLGLLAISALLREVARFVSDWLTWRTRLGVHYALLDAMVGKLHSMPLRIQRSEGVGAITTRLDRSIQGFIGAVTQISFNAFPALVFLVIAAIIMVQLDWRLAAVVLCLAPIPALIALVAAPEQTERERVLLERWSKIYSRFNEVLSGILVVRSFAMEDAEKRRFLADVGAANRVVIRGVATDAGYGAASDFVVAAARIVAIGIGGWLVIKGEITVGTLIAFLGYIAGLFGPVQGLSSIYSTARKATVSLEEIFKILNVQEHLGDAPGARPIDSLNGEVEFVGVSFHYEQADRPLLDDVSFHVAPGQTIAIVGPSGSGKTTMMALLMRFYDPLDGSILLDGRDIRTITQRSLRRQISSVLQDPLLFNDTVRNNIAYGRPEATQEEIEAAAKAANIHDFVMRLPERYDTVVGERGAVLSAGERQRVTIARAVLKNPSILILDEATSSLDAESEDIVQEALERLEHGRTTFVIAHRLATVVRADCILVLQNGRIVEQGRHDELMRLDGYYASLVNRQRRGLISNDATSRITAS